MKKRIGREWKRDERRDRENGRVGKEIKLVVLEFFPFFTFCQEGSLFALNYDM